MDQSQQPPSHQATRSTYYARRLQQATALLEQAQAAMQQEGLERAAALMATALDQIDAAQRALRRVRGPNHIEDQREA